MEKQIAKLKKQLASFRRTGRRRFPTPVRTDVLAVAKAWRESGGKRTELVRRLGLSSATLDSWVKADRAQAQRAVRPVEIVEEVSAPVVRLGASVVVEGLSLGDLIELVRGLR